MKVIEIRGELGLDSLKLAQRPKPRPGPGQMLLNQRLVLPLLLAIAPSLWASAQSILPTTPDDECRDLLRAEIERYRKELRIPGMAVIVLRDQQVIWKSGFGYVDSARKRPYTPDTPQHIASLTKTFAATLVLQLVENGKLDLNEPVADFVSDV